MQTVFQYQREGKREPISSYVVLSNSPRRKELLKCLKPHITSVEVDERGIEEYFMNQFASDDFLTRAAKTCCEISKAKSEIKLAPEHLYISADTIVIADEQIFNKPKDLTEAEEMFRSYFVKSHYVVTSVCLRTSQSLDVFYTLAQIDFVDYPIFLKSNHLTRQVPMVFRSWIHDLWRVFTGMFIPLSVFQ